MRTIPVLTHVVALCIACSYATVGFAKESISKVESLKSLEADAAFAELKAGNSRFMSGHVRKDGQGANDIQRLSKGQAPNSIVLSCSDSRVPPEAVFDQKLGDMFTVRTAGETLSAQAIASIEFAIEKLGTHLVVVMGHTNCGAVKAAVETLNGSTAGSENLDQLVADIHPRIKPNIKNGVVSKDLKDESWANANGVAKDLLTRSKLISNAISTGKAKVVVGLYDLSTGKVEFGPQR